MKSFASFLIKSGVTIFVLGSFLLLIIFYPIILEELHYDFNNIKNNISTTQNLITSPTPVTPVDSNFDIIIPKISANSRVIPNVDPYNEAIYQRALTKGVAQALGTSLPYEAGNMFLFSHSSVNFYEAKKYNSIFYLLYKLEIGDSIQIYYAGDKYDYVVTGKKIVDPKAVTYLDTRNFGDRTLTLMTCWPPGTSISRLLVQAKEITN